MPPPRRVLPLHSLGVRRGGRLTLASGAGQHQRQTDQTQQCKGRQRNSHLTDVTSPIRLAAHGSGNAADRRRRERSSSTQVSPAALLHHEAVAQVGTGSFLFSDLPAFRGRQSTASHLVTGLAPSPSPGLGLNVLRRGTDEAQDSCLETRATDHLGASEASWADQAPVLDA